MTDVIPLWPPLPCMMCMAVITGNLHVGTWLSVITCRLQMRVAWGDWSRTDGLMLVQHSLQWLAATPVALSVWLWWSIGMVCAQKRNIEWIIGSENGGDTWSSLISIRGNELSADTYRAMVAWLSGNALVSINEVTLRRARLLLGWVTMCERVNHLGM